MLWLRGPKGIRLSSSQISQVSDGLVTLRPCIPNVFARKPRCLEEIDRWKATELRQFALYTGKIVLKGVLSEKMYHHFLAFSVALCILVSPGLAKEYNSYASDLLTFFVEQGRALYGSEFLVYNVHSMLHLASDAKMFGNLDECSAFCFESYLHHLKRLVRSGRSPLSQIVKRLGELDRQKKEMSRPAISLRNKKPDNVFALSDLECCEIVSILPREESGQKNLLCRVYGHLEPYFVEPCDSRLIGIYKAKISQTRMKKLPEELLVRKAFMVESDGCLIILTVLHSL